MALKSSLEHPHKSASPLRASIFIILGTLSGCATQRIPATPIGEGYTLFEGVPIERVERQAQQWPYEQVDVLAYLVRNRESLAENIVNDRYWTQVLIHLDQYLTSVRTYRDQHPDCFASVPNNTCHIPTFDMTTWSRENIYDFTELVERAVRVDANRTGQENARRFCEGAQPPLADRVVYASSFEQSNTPFWILLQSLKRHLQELHTFSYMRPNLLAPQSPITRQ